MSRIAIATCRKYPDLSPSNKALAVALAGKGAAVKTLPWNGGDGAEFVGSDLVLLRQTWDYQDDPGGFASWANWTVRKGARVRNTVDLAVWNNDKRTLPELRSAGIPVPVSVPVFNGYDPDLSLIPTEKIVVKPAFGGSGVGVFLTTKKEFKTDFAAACIEAPARSWMVQEFLPEIAEGEWKLTCFGGTSDFAVHLKPQAGEFRVNSRFEPTFTVAAPPDAARKAAEAVASWFGDSLLCYRIDGIVREDRFICTELELTDPDLHLHLADVGSVDRLADLVLNSV